MEHKQGFTYKAMEHWQDIMEIWEPKYGNSQRAYTAISGMAHQRMVGGNGECAWGGSAHGDLIQCAHGLQMFQTILLREAGGLRN